MNTIDQEIMYQLQHASEGALSLQVMSKNCARLGYKRDQVEARLAIMQAAGAISTQYIGSNCYVILLLTN